MLSMMAYLNTGSSVDSLSTVYLWLAVFLSLIVLLVVFLPRLRYLLYLVFVLVAWFPEFSQIEDVRTAEEIQTIYNFRPIPSVTASLFDYLFMAMIIIWLWKFVLPSPRKLFDAPLAKYMLALLAAWVLNLAHGLIRGNEVYYALREFRCQAYFVLCFLMIVTVFKDYRDVRTFIRLSLGMALLVGSYGVVRYLLGIGKELDDIVIVFYDISDSILLYFAMLIVVSYLLNNRISISKGVLAIAFIFPVAFTFLFSYRRGAWLGFVGGLLFLVFIYPNRLRFVRKVLVGTLVPAFSVVLLFYLITPLTEIATIKTRLLSMIDISQDSSNIFRLLDAFNALNSFVHHPILGVGAGGRYDLEFTSDQVLMSFMEDVNRTSHNGYLYILFKSGIIGFFVYLCVYYKFLKVWFKAKNRGSLSLVRAEFMACGAIVVAILINNMTETVSDLLRPSLLLSCAMGWSVILIENLGSERIGTIEPAKTSRRTPLCPLAVHGDSLNRVNNAFGESHSN
jgi:O-antigen ligase